MSYVASSSSFCSMAESVCEEGLEFSGSNNKLLMALMEETHDDQDQNCEEEDRLMNMIQSLEAEISSTSNGYDHMEVGQVDGQDCFTSSSISFSGTEDWDDDMEVVSASSSSSSFDEEMMMNSWSLCAAGGDDISGDYYSCEFYYDGLLLPQESSEVIVL